MIPPRIRGYVARKMAASHWAGSTYSYLKYLASGAARRTQQQEYDAVFVVFEVAGGWILESMARRIASRFEGRYTFHGRPYDLPPARAYYFAHYSHLLHCIRHNPGIWSAKRVALFTHPKDLGMSEAELAFGLNQATSVVCMCSEFHELLARWGVQRDRLVTIVGGADPEVFRPHERGAGVAGFCSSYHWRKAPERILEIIQAMPHRQFVLLGPKWPEWERYSELAALPNLKLLDVDYAEYPSVYAQMDVFISPSVLEGGPIPLLEAMMANVVPVATRTGFAPDLIKDGENGYLFDSDAPISSVCSLIEKAFTLKGDVSHTVEAYSWERFSKQVIGLMS